jgi:hypothetical protein
VPATCPWTCTLSRDTREPCRSIVAPAVSGPAASERGRTPRRRDIRLSRPHRRDAALHRNCESGSGCAVHRCLLPPPLVSPAALGGPNSPEAKNKGHAMVRESVEKVGWPGGPGQLPTRGSHRSGLAQLRHPVRQPVASLGGSSTSAEARRPPLTLSGAVTVTDNGATRCSPWCPTPGPQTGTPLPLHRVLRVEFPCCCGTMRVCDSLYPSRRTQLPSPDATRRRACRFAPNGPGRKAAGRGFVSRSPLPAGNAWR